MEHAPNDPGTTSRTGLAKIPGNGVTAGLDWAKDDHAVCVVEFTTGEVVERFTVEHPAAGLARLLKRLARHGCTEIAVERGDGPVVAALLDAELTVVVINPNQVKNLRSRYGSAGNKDDRFDAYVLADTLRTDRARLRVLQPDSPATIGLRNACRVRKDFVGDRVGMANRLRAHLQTVLPAAVMLFAEIDSAISIAFLTRFTTQDQVDWLTPKRLANWLRSVGYCGRGTPEQLHTRLLTAPRGHTGDPATAAAHLTRNYLAVLATLREQISSCNQQIREQLAAHPDQPIFQSLPRSGTVRAARLLAEIGDCRARFPTAAALACLAGVAPSTRASGKICHVGFRWACDKQLRDALTDFAGDSRQANPWAADLYQRARDRGHDHPHAVRILARAWTDIIWKCWQTNTPYQPDQHRALQRLTAARAPHQTQAA
jgi:transposase